MHGRRHSGARASPASPEPRNTDRRNQRLGLCSWVPGPALTGRPGMTGEFFSILLGRALMQEDESVPVSINQAKYAGSEAGKELVGAERQARTTGRTGGRRSRVRVRRKPSAANAIRPAPSSGSEPGSGVSTIPASMLARLFAPAVTVTISVKE